MRLLSALALVAGLTTLPAAADSLQPLSPPAPMPAFRLPQLGGSNSSDADLRNKVTVIRFWASW